MLRGERLGIPARETAEIVRAYARSRGESFDEPLQAKADGAIAGAAESSSPSILPLRLQM